MSENHSLHQPIVYKNHLLPYSIKTYNVFNNKPDILYHWHSECEFIYIHEGSGKFHVEDVKFESQPGDIICINPNALHSIHPLKDQQHQFTSFNVHLDLIGASVDDYSGIRYLQTLQNGLTGMKPIIQKNDHNYERIRDILFAIFHYANENVPFHSFLLKSKVNELFYYLYVNAYVTRKQARVDAYRKEERIRQTIDYINSHYAENITINDLAKVCGYSVSHFTYFFKTYIGISPNDYLIQKRLKIAAELLENSTQSILEISELSGFTNLSNFNRQFKNYFNCTPKDYRLSKLPSKK